MTGRYDEKRKHARIFFSQAEGVSGVFVFPDFQQVSFTAPVLNISEGGLHFSIKREEVNAIENGSELILTELKNENGLLLDEAIKLEIRWLLDYPTVNSVGFGGEFRELSENGRLLIKGMVIERLNSHAEK